MNKCSFEDNCGLLYTHAKHQENYTEVSNRCHETLIHPCPRLSRIIMAGYTLLIC